jgi:hypothetical protein
MSSRAVATSSADVLLHPVRLRIVQACLGRPIVTVGDLRDELADVPTASLYRHVKVLVDHRVLDVVGEQPVRGTVERSYALRLDAASVAPADIASLSGDDHRHAFMAFLAALLADFGRYVDAGDVDYARDGVGYRQVALWLRADELVDAVNGINAVLLPYLANGPGEGRRRRVLSTVLVPSPDPPSPS